MKKAGAIIAKGSDGGYPPSRQDGSVSAEEIIKHIHLAIAAGQAREGELLPRARLHYFQAFGHAHDWTSVLSDLESQGIVRQVSGGAVKVLPGAREKCREACKRRALDAIGQWVGASKSLGLPATDIVRASCQAFESASAVPESS